MKHKLTKLINKLKGKPTGVIVAGLSALFLLVSSVYSANYWQDFDFNSDQVLNSMDLIEVFSQWGCPGNCIGGSPTPTPTPPQTGGEWSSCDVSPLGVSVQGIPELNGDSGPYVVELAQEGYTAFAGSLNCSTINNYFPQLVDWTKASICNNTPCLRSRVPGGTAICSDVQGGYEYLSYGPERMGGVVDENGYEEWKDLDKYTAIAEQVVHGAGLKLQLSYGTEQMYFEADERGYGWDNVGEVFKDLAPYGDFFMIQAADEWNSNFNNPGHPGYQKPIPSQMHYDPGPEWRAAVKQWYDWIKAANPSMEVWIQLALHKVGYPPDPPSANTLLAYREWLVNPEYGPPVVDGVYVSSAYSYPTTEGPVVSDEEMQKIFRCACGGICEGGISTPTPTPSSSPTPTPTSTPPTQGQITLVEEGITDNKSVAGITLAPGYYYRVYENSAYPCGNQGNHQFVVFDKSQNSSPSSFKNLFVKFLGGGTGFWYEDPTDAIANGETREYHPHANALGLLNQSLNYTWFFRAGVSNEFANGITKLMRQRDDFRMMIPSYCSHDLYYGTGNYSPIDGFARYGYSAAMEAVDYVQANFATNKLITYGGSAGASGSFNIGKDQDNVAGIVMDSMSTDLSAMRDACLQGINVFGNQQGNSTNPCCCPELEADGTPVYQQENGWCAAPYQTTCAEVMGERYGFTLGVDEPYRLVDRGEVDTPIFYIWNYNDAGNSAPYLYNNMQSSLRNHQPTTGTSVPCRVCLPNDNPAIGQTCIADDSLAPQGACNVHVPSGQDEYQQLVNDLYNWISNLVN